MEVRDYFTARLAHLEERRAKKRGEIQRVVLLRVLSFFAVLLAIWPWLFQGPLWVWLAAIAGIIGLGLLVKIHVRLMNELRLFDATIGIVRGELNAVEGSHDHWQSGEQFRAIDSNYSHDLDLFGKGSLFQYLNRAGLSIGQSQLADWMKNPLLDADAIRIRQLAVEEMADLPEWRQKLQALGELVPENELDVNALSSWANSPFENGVPSWTKWLNWCWPLMFVSTLVAYNYDQIGDTILFIMLFLPLLIVGSRIKGTTAHFHRLEKVFKSFRSAAVIFEHLNEQPFSSVANHAIRERCRGASSAFRELASTMELFDSRFNYIVGIFGNMVLYWDLMCVRRLGEWHRQYAHEVDEWLQALAEAEALSSLAAMRFNQKEHSVFPTFSAGDLAASQLVHPLIKPSTRVSNTINLGGNQFAIVTGANMAGKSTFLRTIGVSLVLASMGGPVIATSFNFKPRKLYSSMRTEDSLYSNESYFFNELKRLHTLVNLLNEGEEYFVILDEILKGTNSKDKAEGSFKFIEKLTTLPCTGIVATHDLSLCELEKVYPSQVVNLFFDVLIVDDDLHFDYQLRPGICENMNATFLMHKMGITS